jgi:hypothetical protein
LTALSAGPAAGPAERGGPFSALTGLLLALVGVFAFSALVVLLAYAPDLRSGNDGGAHALSKSAVGFGGLAQALRLTGEPVLVSRSPLPRGRSSGLLIVTPTLETTWSDVNRLGFAGPVLVILPKWLVAPDLLHRGWVGAVQPIDLAQAPPKSLMTGLGLDRRAGVADRNLNLFATPAAPATPFAVGPIEGLQVMAAKGWAPVLTDRMGGVVLARMGDRPIYVLSDPDLLNTRGLKSEDGFVAAIRLLTALRSGEGPYIFDVSLNGFGRQRSALRLLFDPPFLGVTLCLAAAAVLAQLRRRFGPVERRGRAIPFGAAALVDNTAALIRLARREHRMGGRYAELTTALAARAVGAPRALGGEALVAFLDRLGARARLDPPLSELAIQARMVQTPERLLAVARRLHAWREGLSGAPSSAILTASTEAEPSTSAPQPKESALDRQ